jgi:hypothetical protein
VAELSDTENLIILGGQLETNPKENIRYPGR